MIQTRPIAISRVLTIQARMHTNFLTFEVPYLHAFTLAYSNFIHSLTHQLSHSNACPFSYSLTCPPSHLPTSTFANSHTSPVSHLPTLTLAHFDICPSTLIYSSIRQKNWQNVFWKQSGSKYHSHMFFKIFFSCSIACENIKVIWSTHDQQEKKGFFSGLILGPLDENLSNIKNQIFYY